MSDEQTSAAEERSAPRIEIVSIDRDGDHVHIKLRIVDQDAFSVASYLEQHNGIASLSSRIATAATEYLDAPKALFTTEKRRRRKRRRAAPKKLKPSRHPEEAEPKADSTLVEAPTSTLLEAPRAAPDRAHEVHAQELAPPSQQLPF